MNVVRLSPASPTEDLRALQEVSGFARTDRTWFTSGSWTYRKLTDEQVDEELLRTALQGSDGPVEYASLQPCTSYEVRSQDRVCVQKWDMPGGRWTFAAVFDGEFLSLSVLAASRDLFLCFGNFDRTGLVCLICLCRSRRPRYS